MPVQTYLEAMGILLFAIGCAALGSVMKIDFLVTTVAPGLFGLAVGYLGGAARGR